LLETIWESPLEDAPRLVYADWLQETNIPENIARAEFIRVHCERARLEEWDPRYKDLLNQEVDLLEIFDPENKDKGNEFYSRGFLEQEHWGFADNWYEEIAQNPWTSPTWNIRIHLGFDHTLLTLRNSKTHLSRVHKLTLRSFVYAEDGFQGINESPSISSEHARIVTEWLSLPNWVHLEHLTLEGEITNVWLDALAECRGLQRIKSLKFDATQMRFTPSDIFFQSRFLSNITQLKLVDGWRNVITTDLLAQWNLPSLQRLEMEFNDMPDVMLESWNDLPLIRHLTRLTLKNIQEGLDTLAQCQTLSNLRTLDLDFSAYGRQEDLLTIASSPIFDNLQVLKISCFEEYDSNGFEKALRNRFQDRLKWNVD
jgi:uncharacterized protein (TIGR02996 family)